MANKKISEPFPSKATVVDFGKLPLPKTVPIQQPAGIPKVTVIRYGNEKKFLAHDAAEAGTSENYNRDNINNGDA